jgi:hypothetical protein
MPVNPERLAYAAGFFDGEGTVGIDRFRDHGYASYRYRLRVRIPNTNAQVVQWFKDNFGGSIADQKKSGNRKPQTIWSTSGNNALQFIKMISPYLLVKQPAAKVAIQYQENIQLQSRMSDSERNRRESLYLEMKQLNRRGSDDG